jgi:hypothetical protein
MNNKQEKWFWFATMILSYALAIWVLLGAIEGHHSFAHIIGLSLICYLTTKCYTSCNEYN